MSKGARATNESEIDRKIDILSLKISRAESARNAWYGVNEDRFKAGEIMVKSLNKELEELLKSQK